MRLQAHLKKLFAGIHSVRFGKEETEIVAMRSLEGEEVPLSTAVPITPDVEVTRSDVTEPLNYSLSPCFPLAGLAECSVARDADHAHRAPGRVCEGGTG